MKLNIDKSSWKKVRLGDVATAPSIRINNPSESGFDRFIGNANIGQWDFRLTSWEHTDSVTSAMKGFETGDYLFVRRSLYASDFRERSPRATFAGVCSGDIITVREHPEKIADGFLIGVLNSPEIWKFVVANASGSITRRIKWRDLANYEFLLPPKDQQAKLAELLWAADEAKEAAAIFPNLLLNLQKAEFRNRAVEDPQSVARLGDILEDIIAGKSPKAASRPADASEYGVLKVSAVGNQSYVESENKALVSPDDFSPKYEVKAGFVLVTRANAVPSGVGRPCLVEKTRSGLMLSDKTLRLVPRQGATSERFLYQNLQSASYRSHVESVIGGTEAKNISQALLREAPIWNPPAEVQTEILTALKIQDETIIAAKKNCLAASQLLKSLIRQIF